MGSGLLPMLFLHRFQFEFGHHLWLEEEDVCRAHDAWDSAEDASVIEGAQPGLITGGGADGSLTLFLEHLQKLIDAPKLEPCSQGGAVVPHSHSSDECFL